MKKLTNIILALAVVLMTVPNGATSSETVAFAEDSFTELFCIDFDDVSTVTEATDKAAFNAIYSGKADLLSPRSNFNYTVASKEDGGDDKYIQMDSDYAGSASGFTAIQLWVPGGGIKEDNGTYKLSFDAKLNSASNKPFLRVKTNHTDNPMADTTIANNGGIYNWGPCLGGIAPINDSGARDQSAARIYGTYSKFEGVENTGWFTASYENNTRVELSLGEWHTTEIIIDTVNDKAYYYFDGIYSGCQQGTIFQKKFICGQYSAKTIQLQIEQGWNVANGFQLDNIALSHSTGTFNGTNRVKAGDVKLVDCTDEAVEITDEISAIAKKFEISVSNVAESTSLASGIVLKKDGVPVSVFLSSYVADSTDPRCGKLTVAAENYLESDGNYTLNAFGKEYSFTIKYPKIMAVGGLYVSKAGQKVDDISTLSAGETVSANITVLNPTGEDKSVALIAACFDGARLKSVYYKNVDLDSQYTVVPDSLSFDIPTAAQLGIKLFAVDNMEGFAAASECVELGAVIQPESGTVFEIGKTDKELKNKNITMLVYHPGKTSANLVEEADVSNVIYTVAQTKAGEEGDYKFKVAFDNTDASGLYKAYTNCGDGAKLTRLSFVDADENKGAVTTLLGSADFVSDAKANAAELGFGEFSDDVPDAAYSILKDYYDNNTITVDDVDTNRAAVRKSEIIACVNSGEMTNMFEHSKYLTAETADISNYFANSYFTDELQQNITADIKNAEINSISGLKNSLNKAFVLNLIENPNGYENLVPVLKRFAGKIGVSEASINKSVAQKISGNTYADHPSLKAAILAAGSGSSGGGGGATGGGGGGGSLGGGKHPTVSDGNGGVPVTGDQNSEIPVKEIPKNIFTDVPDTYWGRDAIVYLTERNILNGKSEKLFCPEEYVTREEFTKMIVLAFCDMESGGTAEFSDVDKNEWYYKYIAVASDEGLITGYDDKTFGIGQRITRQDMAVILNRAAQAFNYGFKMPEYVEEFADNESIADYAYDAVYTLKNAGVVKGDGNSFNPKSFAQRAEAATIIYNMLSL